MASEPSRSRGKKEIERANQRIVQRHKSSGENDRVDPVSSGAPDAALEDGEILLGSNRAHHPRETGFKVERILRKIA
jgi:hypothetical protein